MPVATKWRTFNSLAAHCRAWRSSPWGDTCTPVFYCLFLAPRSIVRRKLASVQIFFPVESLIALMEYACLQVLPANITEYLLRRSDSPPGSACRARRTIGVGSLRPQSSGLAAGRPTQGTNIGGSHSSSTRMARSVIISSSESSLSCIRSCLDSPLTCIVRLMPANGSRDRLRCRSPPGRRSQPARATAGPGR